MALPGWFYETPSFVNIGGYSTTDYSTSGWQGIIDGSCVAWLHSATPQSDFRIYNWAMEPSDIRTLLWRGAKLLAYYRFDSPGGRAVNDSSGNSNHAFTEGTLRFSLRSSSSTAVALQERRLRCFGLEVVSSK